MQVGDGLGERRLGKRTTLEFKTRAQSVEVKVGSINGAKGKITKLKDNIKKGRKKEILFFLLSAPTTTTTNKNPTTN